MRRPVDVVNAYVGGSVVIARSHVDRLVAVRRCVWSNPLPQLPGSCQRAVTDVVGDQATQWLRCGRAACSGLASVQDLLLGIEFAHQRAQFFPAVRA
jgi:hypothetical protein